MVSCSALAAVTPRLGDWREGHCLGGSGDRKHSVSRVAEEPGAWARWGAWWGANYEKTEEAGLEVPGVNPPPLSWLGTAVTQPLWALLQNVPHPVCLRVWPLPSQPLLAPLAKEGGLSGGAA